MLPLQAWMTRWLANTDTTVTIENLWLKELEHLKRKKQYKQHNLQVGGLALLDFFALAAGGCFLAAECARDAHQQAAVAQEEAADVHQHEEEQQRPQAEAHHRAQPQAAEQGFC